MDKELLFSITKRDFRIDTFRSGGAGGQNQNKRDTGVRVVHLDSGAVGESREEKQQGQNKKIAFRRLIKSPTFTKWLRCRIREALNKKTVEQEVEEMMEKLEDFNLEVKDDRGKWVRQGI